MKRTPRPQAPGTPSAPRDAPLDDESSRVVARPDGFYWIADDGRQEFGPFPSAMDALVALRAGIDTGIEPDETLAEAEAEIGIVEPLPTEDGAPGS